MSETNQRIPEGGRRSACVCFVTMGCAKNEVDTRDMQAACESAGMVCIEEPGEADVVVVNTCSFIQSATEESIDAVLEAAGLENVASGEAWLIVAGCMPARYGADLQESLEEAAAFVPCSREDDIVEVIRSLPGFTDRFAVCEGETAAEAHRNASSQVFGYVKISDGCDRYCSYCTIPFIRGRYHSFTYEDIAQEAASLIDGGAREIVLIGQDTGRWGQDFDNPRDLADLVDGLADAFPQTWFRVMYLQPEGVSDRLLETMAAHDNVCSYLDIPLQHVCAPILRAMNRRGDRATFEALVAHIKETVSDITLRTTLIAGFPGETDEQFEELCDFVEEGLFDYVGVFPYSREESTAAYDLPDQIEEEEKIYRATRVREIADAVSAAKVAERMGCTFDVLIEGVEEDGQLFGRAQCQAPEVDGSTYVDRGEVGEVLPFTIVDTLFYEMEGE